MIVVVVDSNIGVIRVKYLRMAPVSPSPRLSQTLCSLALLRLNLKDNSNPLSITVCFMKILPYSKIYLLQTGCLHIVIRVARSYYNARLRVVGL